MVMLMLTNGCGETIVIERSSYVVISAGISAIIVVAFRGEADVVKLLEGLHTGNLPMLATSF